MSLDAMLGWMGVVLAIYIAGKVSLVWWWVRTTDREFAESRRKIERILEDGRQRAIEARWRP